jgi:7-cyano-7-deazaguanine synthase in queuosine biosynthesis
MNDVKIPGGPITLCMYSGGLDSTGMLFKLLRIDHEAGRNIHIHHVNLVNVQNRSKAERAAVQKVLNYFATVGSKFTSSESTIEYPTFNGSMFKDPSVYLLSAVNIAAVVPRVDRIAFGMTKTDFSIELMQRIKRNDFVYDELIGRHVERVYPLKEERKESVWHMLPPAVRAMTWSCRLPIYKNDVTLTCGQCKPCIDIAHVKSKF